MAVIPDGNRRWAKQHLCDVVDGYKEGGRKIFLLIDWFLERRDLDELSIFMLSTENFLRRSKLELNYLSSLGVKFLKELVQRYEGKIALNVAGQWEKFDENIKQEIKDALFKLKNGEKKLNILLNYGGKAEILNAVNSLIQSKDAEMIDDAKFKEYLWVGSDVDLIIRTGKEHRLSNLLIYQAAYAELFFLDIYWPEISEEILNKVMEDFYARERRFGK